jgi:hypothetical protein
MYVVGRLPPGGAGNQIVKRSHRIRPTLSAAEGGDGRHRQLCLLGPTSAARSGARVSLCRCSGVGCLADQGHQRLPLRVGVFREGREVLCVACGDPDAGMPVARTPQSQQPPVRLRQRGPRLVRESLREVTVLLESGYTQQKVQPRQQLDVRRSRVKGQGGGAPLCAFSVPQYTQWECTLARQCSVSRASLHWQWQ